MSRSALLAWRRVLVIQKISARQTSEHHAQITFRLRYPNYAPFASIDANAKHDTAMQLWVPRHFGKLAMTGVEVTAGR
jgi:hypothetical protein